MEKRRIPAAKKPLKRFERDFSASPEEEIPAEESTEAIVVANIAQNPADHAPSGLLRAVESAPAAEPPARETQKTQPAPLPSGAEKLRKRKMKRVGRAK